MRKKKFKNINLIVLLIITIILVINMGYSLFYESLNIGGSATTITPIAGDALNIEIIPYTSGYYSSVLSGCYYPTIPDKICIGAIYPDTMTETLNTNTLNVIFNTSLTDSKATMVINWKMKFKNKSSSDFTNGTISSQIVIGSNNITILSSQTPITLSSNSIDEMTGTFEFNRITKAQVKFTIQYLVNGVLKYFYYDLTVNVI
jgi:hypothetical protein